LPQAELPLAKAGKGGGSPATSVALAQEVAGNGASGRQNRAKSTCFSNVGGR
jgi:hypothetical protein